MSSDEKPEQEMKKWVMTLDPGMRFIGVVQEHDPETRTFSLQPAFEHFNQIKLAQGVPPERMEAVAPVDMVGAVPLRIRPTAFIWIHELPEWRQKEIGRMLDGAMDEARAYALQRRSGIVLK
jgi:hypothetical protein